MMRDRGNLRVGKEEVEPGVGCRSCSPLLAFSSLSHSTHVPSQAFC